MRTKTFNDGDKVWMLTIVGHSLIEQSNGRKRNYYQCKCDCGNEKIVILTVLHEFRHFLQMPKIHNMSQYYKLFEKYNYENHPLEIDAIKFQKEHYSACRRTLKRKGVI